MFFVAHDQFHHFRDTSDLISSVIHIKDGNRAGEFFGQKSVGFHVFLVYEQPGCSTVHQSADALLSISIRRYSELDPGSAASISSFSGSRLSHLGLFRSRAGGSGFSLDVSFSMAEISGISSTINTLK